MSDQEVVQQILTSPLLLSLLVSQEMESALALQPALCLKWLLRSVMALVMKMAALVQVVASAMQMTALVQVVASTMQMATLVKVVVLVMQTAALVKVLALAMQMEALVAMTTLTTFESLGYQT